MYTWLFHTVGANGKFARRLLRPDGVPSPAQHLQGPANAPKGVAPCQALPTPPLRQQPRQGAV